jgi:hypothetical protein
MSAIHPWTDTKESHEEREPQWGSAWVIVALCAGLLFALWR